MTPDRFRHTLFVNTELEYSIDEQTFPGLGESWHLSQPALLILEDQLSSSAEQFGYTMDQTLCYVDTEPDLYSIIDSADVSCSDLWFGNSVDDVIDSRFGSPDVEDALAYSCEHWNSSFDWIDRYEILPEFVELTEISSFDLDLTVESQLRTIQFDRDFNSFQEFDNSLVFDSIDLNPCQDFDNSLFFDSIEFLPCLHNRE